MRQDANRKEVCFITAAGPTAPTAATTTVAAADAAAAAAALIIIIIIIICKAYSRKIIF